MTLNTVISITEPLPDPLRSTSVFMDSGSGLPHFGRSRDVQLLSDGVDPMYEAWLIQLKGKFLEPQYASCNEQVQMHYVFKATSGTAQSHLLLYMLQTSIE